MIPLPSGAIPRRAMVTAVAGAMALALAGCTSLQSAIGLGWLVVHDFTHILRQPTEFVGDFFDRSRHAFQSRVGKLENLE